MIDLQVALDAYLAAAVPVVDSGGADTPVRDDEAVSAALKVLRGTLLIDGPSGEDEHAERAARIRAVLYDQHESEQARMLALVEAVDPPPVVRMRSVSTIHDAQPAPILSLSGRGAWLSVGHVALVSGEGGLGKSSLVTSIAVDVASSPPGVSGADVFDGPLTAGPGVRDAGPFKLHNGGGPVVLLSYEDDPGTVADKARKYAHRAGVPLAGLEDLQVLEIDDPVFGPVPTDSGAELYNARPGRLPAWRTLELAVARAKPRLLLIDPVTVSYCSDQSNLSGVREYISALGKLARRYSLGVVLVAHSTKDTRKRRNNEDKDPFEPGLVSGSAAWVDAVRGVASLQWGEADAPGERVIACPKANYGPARLVRGLETVRMEYGEIVGFKGSGEWRDPRGSGADTRGGGSDGETRPGFNKHGVAK